MAKHKKKRGPGDTASPLDEETPRPKPAPAMGTSLGKLLSGVKLDKKPDAAAKKNAAAWEAAKKASSSPKQKTQAKPAAPPTPAAEPEKPAPPLVRPSDTLRGEDRTAYFDSLAGVRPIAGRRPERSGRALPPAPPPPADRPDPDAPARARLAALVSSQYEFDIAREEDGWVEGLRRDAPVAALDVLRRRAVTAESTLDLHRVRAAEVDSRVTRFVREKHRAGIRRLLIIHGKGTHSENGVGVLAEAVAKALTEGGAAPLVLAFASAPVSLGGTGALLVELSR